jgi:hypothetical protein
VGYTKKHLYFEVQIKFEYLDIIYIVAVFWQCSLVTCFIAWLIDWLNEWNTCVVCATHRNNTSHNLVCILFYTSCHSTSFIFCRASPKGGPGQPSQYSNSLQAGRSRDRIPVGARFSAPVQTGPGAHPASYTVGTGSFPGVKQPGRGIDHPPPSSAEVKERVEL